MRQKRVVVALGGNALIKKGEKPTIAHQLKNVREAMEHLLPLLKTCEIVLTHGNGPQVGNILLRVEEALGKAYTLPLEVCVAESQGEIGYVIEQALQNVLLHHHVKKHVVTFLTQVVVDKHDQAFSHPTKPIGPFYSKRHAAVLQRKGLDMVYQRKRGYRRVVPSPQPLRIDGVGVIQQVMKHAIVIAAGGGGIPVTQEKGKLKGIAAVIDKDLASACLARDIGAELLLILTGVKGVALNYGRKNERPLRAMRVAEAKRYLHEGQFPEGSMGPKIEAAMQFLQQGGKKVVITDPSHVAAALAGREGTTITRA